MAKKAKTAAAPAVATVAAPAPAPVAVPSGIRSKKGGGNLLAMLAAKGTKAAPPKPEKKKRRTMSLSEEAQTQFLRVAKVKVVADLATAFIKVERPVLDDLFQSCFLKTYWEARFLPDNPRVAVQDGGKVVCDGLYSLVKKFHIDTIEPEDGESPADAMTRVLVEVVGLDETKAATLVENELDFTPELTIPITELTKDDATADAANELVRFLLGQIKVLKLSDEQKAALIRVKAGCEVLDKDGFMDRLPEYCDTIEQLTSLLSIVFRPEWHLRSLKLYEGQPARRRQALLDAVQEIIVAEEAAKEAKEAD